MATTEIIINRGTVFLALGIFVLISTGLSQIALGKEATLFTLDDAIQVALTNNPAFKVITANQAIKQADITEAKAFPNPSVISDNGVAESTYRAGIQQTIILGGDRQKRIALAQAQGNVISENIRKAQLTLRTSVRRAYTQLYNQQQKHQTYQQLLTLSEELLTIAQKREKAGDIAQVDVLQSQLVVLQAQNNLQTATYDQAQALTEFATILNQPNLNKVTLAPPSQFPEGLMNPPVTQNTVQVDANESIIDRLISRALKQRPEMQENQIAVTVTQHAEALSKAERIPDLTLAVGPDIVVGAGGSINAFAIASMEIPLFNRQQGAIEKAKAQRQQLYLESEAIRNQISLEVKTAYNNFEKNKVLLQRYRHHLLPTAHILVKKARLAFEAGKTSILFPINAQQTYIETQLGYLQTLQAYQQAITDLEQATGSGL